MILVGWIQMALLSCDRAILARKGDSHAPFDTVSTYHHPHPSIIMALARRFEMINRFENDPIYHRARTRMIDPSALEAERQRVLQLEAQIKAATRKHHLKIEDPQAKAVAAELRRLDTRDKLEEALRCKIAGIKALEREREKFAGEIRQTRLQNSTHG